jgi:hypothetical protein
MKRIEVGVFSRMFRVWMKTLKSKCVLLTLIVTAVELCVARSATAQCYTFQAGDEASLVNNIQNLPAPTVNPYLGTVRYDYNLKNLGGNKAIVTVNGSSYSSTELGGFGISVFSDPTWRQCLWR